MRLRSAWLCTRYANFYVPVRILMKATTVEGRLF
jgi:hypothetical protein